MLTHRFSGAVKCCGLMYSAGFYFLHCPPPIKLRLPTRVQAEGIAGTPAARCGSTRRGAPGADDVPEPHPVPAGSAAPSPLRVGPRGE